MPGDSMVKDLAEMFEFYAEDVQCNMPSIVLATYVAGCLRELKKAVRMKMPDEDKSSNAEAGADGEPETEGAQNLSPSSSLKGSLR